MGQEQGGGLTGLCSRPHRAAIKISACCIFPKVWGPLPSSHGSLSFLVVGMRARFSHGLSGRGHSQLQSQLPLVCSEALFRALGQHNCLFFQSQQDAVSASLTPGKSWMPSEGLTWLSQLHTGLPPFSLSHSSSVWDVNLIRMIPHICHILLVPSSHWFHLCSRGRYYR